MSSLTPGTDIKDVRPESGGREVSALDAERDPQQIFYRAFPTSSLIPGTTVDKQGGFLLSMCPGVETPGSVL